MGIRHLQTFMERKVQGGIYSVRMEREIRNANVDGAKPLVVIDVLALFGLFCSDKQSLLCGSQVMLLEQMVSEFYGRLTDAGAELVFFYDGTVQPTKQDTWIMRQDTKYDRMLDILDAIDKRTPLALVAEEFERTIPHNTCIKLEEVAKKHGQLYISTHVECDQALAAYATAHNALAIVSHDSDYLIFPGEWQYWAANDINLQTLTTRGFNRRALLNTLDLRWPQMAMWATLAGNDIFKYDELVPFLNTMGQNNQKFYMLANYVRSLPWQRKYDDKTLKTILERVYRNRTQPSGAFDWLTQSLRFYRIDDEALARDPSIDPLKQFLVDVNQHFVYNVLNGIPFNVTLLFFDYRSNELGSYYDIISPIIARIGGIILYHHQHERQEVVVLIKRNHKESHTMCTVPVMLPGTISPPHLMELLSDDANLQQALHHRKVQLLAWVCSDDLLQNIQDVLAIPVALLLTVLTLYRLRQCGAMSLSEADLLLLIADQLWRKDGFDPTQEPYPRKLIGRAFRLGFLFHKVYAHFARVAKSLGLGPEYSPSLPYDGHRFHNQYRVWCSNRIEPVLLAPINAWRLYSRAKRMKVSSLSS